MIQLKLKEPTFETHLQINLPMHRALTKEIMVILNDITGKQNYITVIYIINIYFLKPINNNFLAFLSFR